MFKYESVTHKVIKAYYAVYNELGTGFLESVYENAMLYVLKNDLELHVKRQSSIQVNFRGIAVGNFVADLIVEEKVIVELKAVSNIIPEHKAQIINYLKATNIEVGLLMNFGHKPEFKRYIFDKK